LSSARWHFMTAGSTTPHFILDAPRASVVHGAPSREIRSLDRQQRNVGDIASDAI
jgi:hypothetical protein